MSLSLDSHADSLVNVLTEKDAQGVPLYDAVVVGDCVAALAISLLKASPDLVLDDAVRDELHRVARTAGVDDNDDGTSAARKIEAYFAAHPLPEPLTARISRLVATMASAVTTTHAAAMAEALGLSSSKVPVGTQMPPVGSVRGSLGLLLSQTRKR